MQVQQQQAGMIAQQVQQGMVALAPGLVVPEETEVISRKKLQELVNQISPGEVLDPDVEEVRCYSTMLIVNDNAGAFGSSR